MKTYAIGDIHGCYHTLLRLINKLPFEQGDKFVFLGDYIDRGLYSKQVVQYVKELTESGQAIALKGNHEDMCTKKRDAQIWISNGGDTTLNSYDTRTPEEKVRPDFRDEEASALWRKNLPKVPKEDKEWMEKLPLFYEDDKYFYVHAGVYPELELENQIEDDMLWIRNRFLNSKVFFGKIVVFGHTPMNKVLIQKNKIGIDTGCVYGLELTCYCPETNTYYSEKLNERDQNEYSKDQRD